MGAACEDGEDGGSQGRGVIGQDCLAVPPLGRKRPKYTQHTDLRPEKHYCSLGQNKHSSDLIQTLEAETHFPVTSSQI